MQTEVLYEKAVELADLKGDETVLDLYCGIGTISLFFARKARQVFGVEIVPEAIADARKNAERNNITNATFAVGAAEEVIPRLYREEGIAADVVVVDPPRRAVMHACWKRFSKLHPKRSCMFPVTLRHSHGIWLCLRRAATMCARCSP